MLAVVIVIAAGLSAACHETQELGNPPQTVSDGGDATLSSYDANTKTTPTECATRCNVAARIGCSADPALAPAQCQAVCAYSPTEDQLSCLTEVSCIDFLDTLSGRADVCKIGIETNGE